MVPEPLAVKDLIEQHSIADHVARADAYFASISDDDLMLRKPFFGIDSTHANLSGIADVLERLRLFPRARVLDFGAGTAWFSRILAMLGCLPIATDVSEHALALGQRAFARDPLAAGLAVDWRVFDGTRLPLEDEAVDRVLCFDSFHHVPDQAAMLREFYRVLVTGGRAVFHEPGPHHSRLPQSQYEMRHHGVIENDIVIEDIWEAAKAIGFTDIELTLTNPTTVSVSLERYTRIVSGEADRDDTALVLRNLSDGAHNLRIFALSKGPTVIDSRHGMAGLAGTLDVWMSDTDTAVLRGSFRATNTGSKPWRASDGQVGGVSLGIRQVRGAELLELGRVILSDQPVLPGQSVERTFEFHASVTRPARLMIDLVAELVTWFELVGTTPIFIDLA